MIAIFKVLIIPLIIGIFASIVAVIFYDFIVFRRFYLNLCKEIDDNYRRISDNELNSQFSRMREILERRIQYPNIFEWIGFGKTISIWILVQKTDTNPTDYYRYLKNNDLRNFIQSRGYYHYIKENEEVITLFYLSCEDLSNQTQNHERIFNYSPETIYPNFNTATNNEKREILENYIGTLREMIIDNRPQIILQYTNVRRVLKKNIFHVLKLYISKNLLPEA
jgi:hypothetical protein